jgi:hypothetical protein
MQPACAVLIFAHYGENEPTFTADESVQAKAKRLSQMFRRVLGAATADFVFMGRIGEPLPRMGVVRSVRRPVTELMTSLSS